MDFVTLWGALAPGDLPAPVAEYRFHPVRRWRFDFAWPAERGGLALEVDGGQWKTGGGRHNTDRDREKLNVAAALGWRVLRFSPRALADDPAGCIELAAAALVLGRDPGAIWETSGGNPGAGGGDLPGPAPELAPKVQLVRAVTPKLRHTKAKLAQRETVKLQRPAVKLQRSGAG